MRIHEITSQPGDNDPFVTGSASGDVKLLATEMVLTAEVLWSLVRLPLMKKIITKVLITTIPVAGAAWTLTDAYKQAMNGEYTNMWIDLADAGLSIVALFGYAAGGVGGYALTAAGIAGQLYVQRTEIMDIYVDNYTTPEFQQEYSKLSQANKDVLANKLIQALAGQLYEELKQSAMSAMKQSNEPKQYGELPSMPLWNKQTINNPGLVTGGKLANKL